MREPYFQTGFLRLCWQKLFWLIVWNLLFLLCCLPVVTAPAAATALACVCQGMLLEEPRLFRRFFRSFRQNFLPSLPLGLLFLAGPAALLYGCVFYRQAAQGDGPAVVLSIFCLICVYLLFCMGAFAFQMLARVELKTAAVIRNSFYLTFRQPGTVLGWELLAFAIPAAMWLTFPYSLPLILLLGASLPCFTAARGILPLIDTLIRKE